MASLASNNASCIGKSRALRLSNHVSFDSYSTSYIAVKPRLPVKVSPSSMAIATSSVPSYSSSSSSRGYNVLPFDKISNEEFDKDMDSSSRVSEKLEEWMRDSVGDIVKNLKQAPLLVQIYANNGTRSTEIKTERAVTENWPNVMKKKNQSPDGIILVEELGCGKESDLGDDIEKTEDGTKAWGVLIQGRRGERECGSSACYLLKTSRVRAAGLGLFCTHFCLVKVNSFRNSALQQFTDSWLLH